MKTQHSAKVPTYMLAKMLENPVLWLDRLRSEAIKHGAQHTSVTPIGEVLDWLHNYLREGVKL